MKVYKAPKRPHTAALTGDAMALLDKAHEQRRAYHEKVRAAVQRCPLVPVYTEQGTESWRMLAYDQRAVVLARDEHTVMHGHPVRFGRVTLNGIGGHGRGLRCGRVEPLIMRLQRGRS